ncbi:hypothetical protein PMAYCL1PPCAC_10038, partial [Pristionchus mayeri]
FQMLKLFLLGCLALAAAYSTPKKEPKMPELDDPEDYDSPVANHWPLGRDPLPEEQAQEAAAQKFQQREAAQIKIEAILKAKMAAAAAAKKASSTHAPSNIVMDEPTGFTEPRPLGYGLVLRAGDMVRRVQRFLNNYEQQNPGASEEDWMIAFLDEMKSIDEEDNHILTDRLFTVLKERRTHHH